MESASLGARVVAKALKAPVVVLPTVLGGASLAAAGFLGVQAGFLAFMGVTGLVLGIGAGATRLLLRTERLADEVAAEEEAARLREAEARPDAIERRLRAMGDDRALEDLKLLREQRRRALEAAEKGSFHVPPEIVTMGEQLYRSSLDSWERSAELWEAARKMATRGARDGLLKQRETLLQEVSRSVAHWAHTLDRLQAAALQRGDTAEELRGIRAEMDEGLAVAKRVEERMQDLERDLTRPSERALRE